MYNFDTEDPFGLAEVKCLYSVQLITPAEACLHKGFCSTLEASSIGEHQLKLKRKQVLLSSSRADGYQQAQVVCIFTVKGLSIKRIPLTLTIEKMN